ncbi:hypothetical protein AAVH_26210 [Aphelenchoides avenae]|nr:hypothetical protein AAVH_26210 [Aphelenchus avenae]
MAPVSEDQHAALRRDAIQFLSLEKLRMFWPGSYTFSRGHRYCDFPIALRSPAPPLDRRTVKTDASYQHL